MGENQFFKLTSGWCYDREFGFGFLAKRKNDEEPELVEDGTGTWDLYESDGAEGLEDYSDYVRENSAWAFVDEEEISEEEFNDSANWKEPTSKEIAKLSQDYSQDGYDDEDEDEEDDWQTQYESQLPDDDDDDDEDEEDEEDEEHK